MMAAGLVFCTSFDLRILTHKHQPNTMKNTMKNTTTDHTRPLLDGLSSETIELLEYPQPLYDAAHEYADMAHDVIYTWHAHECVRNATGEERDYASEQMADTCGYDDRPDYDTIATRLAYWIHAYRYSELVRGELEAIRGDVEERMGDAHDEWMDAQERIEEHGDETPVREVLLDEMAERMGEIRHEQWERLNDAIAEILD